MTLESITHPLETVYTTGKTTIGEYEYTLPAPTPQTPLPKIEKFCPILSIYGPKRLCDWRECGMSGLCRGTRV